MNTPESLNGMVSDLIRRGLPVEYAERAAAEFTDHHRDLIDELQAAGWSESQASAEASQRLGDLRKLTNKTVRDYQRRYWCARWPLLTFVVAPIPAFIAAFAAIGYSMLFVRYCLSKIGLVQSSATILGELPVAVKGLVLVGITMLLPAILLCGFDRLARRAAVSGRWVFVAALMLGMFAGMIRWQYIPPHHAVAPLLTRNPQTGSCVLNPHGGEILPEQLPASFWITLPFGPAYWSFWSFSWICQWYMTSQQLGQLLLPAVAAGTLLIVRRRIAIQAGRQFMTC